MAHEAERQELLKEFEILSEDAQAQKLVDEEGLLNTLSDECRELNKEEVFADVGVHCHGTAAASQALLEVEKHRVDTLDLLKAKEKALLDEIDLHNQKIAAETPPFSEGSEKKALEELSEKIKTELNDMKAKQERVAEQGALVEEEIKEVDQQTAASEAEQARKYEEYQKQSQEDSKTHEQAMLILAEAKELTEREIAQLKQNCADEVAQRVQGIREGKIELAQLHQNMEAEVRHKKREAQNKEDQLHSVQEAFRTDQEGIEEQIYLLQRKHDANENRHQAKMKGIRVDVDAHQQDVQKLQLCVEAHIEMLKGTLIARGIYTPEEHTRHISQMQSELQDQEQELIMIEEELEKAVLSAEGTIKHSHETQVKRQHQQGIHRQQILALEQALEAQRVANARDRNLIRAKNTLQSSKSGAMLPGMTGSVYIPGHSRMDPSMAALQRQPVYPAGGELH